MTDRKQSFAVNRFLRNLPENANAEEKAVELIDKLRNGKISERDFRQRAAELGLGQRAIADCVTGAKAERDAIDTLPKG